MVVSVENQNIIAKSSVHHSENYELSHQDLYCLLKVLLIYLAERFNIQKISEGCTRKHRIHEITLLCPLFSFTSRLGRCKTHIKSTRYLEFQETIKYFEISVPRHIRFAELRKKLFEQPYLTNIYICNWTLEVRDILKNIVKKRRNCSFLLFSTIIFCLLLDVHVSAGSRFSIRDKRLFETR